MGGRRPPPLAIHLHGIPCRASILLAHYRLGQPGIRRSRGHSCRVGPVRGSAHDFRGGGAVRGVRHHGMSVRPRELGRVHRAGCDLLAPRAVTEELHGQLAARRDPWSAPPRGSPSGCSSEINWVLVVQRRLVGSRAATGSARWELGDLGRVRRYKRDGWGVVDVGRKIRGLNEQCCSDMIWAQRNAERE